MLAHFGYGVLALTFALALYSIAAAAYGEQKHNPAMIESARRAMLLTFPLITISVLILIYLIVNDHYEIEYVWSVSNREMPLYLKITALWGGQAGSLVFWSWLMSAFASAVTLRKWDRDKEFLPWVIVVSSVTLAFFLGMSVFFENPFKFIPIASIPQNGRGLNPLLRHPGMIAHPPMLYLGFVAFTIPYAFAIAALITGRTDDRWIRITRRWTLWAWLFLSIGLVLGMRWSYDVLGWGGYWAWDPVETSALMPWLTGTAFLHSVMIQERRDVFKFWNMLLIMLTYALVIFGTFLTRSGVLSSVHAFAQSAIGPFFFAFIGMTFIVSIALLLYRWEDLKSDVEIKSMLSRETLLLFGALLFLGILVVSFWGVIFPLISELATGQKVTVGPPFYERATGPLWAGLMILMAISPFSAWVYATAKSIGRTFWKPAAAALLVPIALFAGGMRNWIALTGFTLAALGAFATLYDFWRGARARSRRSGENIFLSLWKLILRNRRRYGGYIIHISMMVMAVGILGIELFQTETQQNLAVGETMDIAGYTLKFDSLAQFPHIDGRYITRAALTIYKNGRELGKIYPRYDLYPSGEPMTIPGVRSSWLDDVYAVVINWEHISPQSTPIRVYHNPLVKWMWVGSYLFVIGMLIAAYPDKDPAYVPVRASTVKRGRK